MTIEKIETFILKDKLNQSFFFSQWEYSERCICVIKVTASNGQFGWGEGYGPATVLESGIKLLEPIVLGENPLENEVIWNKMYRKTADFVQAHLSGRWRGVGVWVRWVGMYMSLRACMSACARTCGHVASAHACAGVV